MPVSVINKNPSLMLANHLYRYNTQIAESLDKLSSGLSVRSPKDNSAAYFLAADYDKRKSNTNFVADSLEDNVQGLKSALDGLNEVKGLLEEAGELANTASNTDDDNLRSSLATEYNDIMSQIGTVVNQFSFNGVNLLSSQQTFTVQIEEDASNTLSYTLFSTNVTAATGLNLGTGSGGGGTNYSSARDATNGFGGTGNGDAAEKAAAANFYAAINGTRPDDSEGSGITQVKRNINRVSTSLLILENRQATLQNKAANYEAAKSALVGLNEAEETTNLTTAQVKQQAGAFFLAQTNSNMSSIQSLIYGFGR